MTDPPTEAVYSPTASVRRRHVPGDKNHANVCCSNCAKLRWCGTVRKKAPGRRKKPAIDSDEEARQNASIELELDSELEELLSEEDNGSDDEETIQAGFFTPRLSHAPVAFNPQAPPVLKKESG